MRPKTLLRAGVTPRRGQSSQAERKEREREREGEMEPRRPVVAGRFYPAGESCLASAREMLDDAGEPPSGEAVGGVTPHAGWSFSGKLAAKTVKALAQARPETVVLFTALHRWGWGGGGGKSAVYPEGAWETPVGLAEVDSALASALLEEAGELAASDALAHAEEHSGEVVLPFFQVALPESKILPVVVPPSPQAQEVGKAAAKAAKAAGRKAVAVGSTDLSHYGRSAYGWAPKGEGGKALAWVKEVNDKRMVELMLGLEAEKVVAEAERNRNACGSGAVAAALGWAREMGAKEGVLLEYTTSHDVMREEERPTMFVGYAAVVFVR